MDNQPLATKSYAPPKRSSGNGCLVASFVVGALLLLTILALVLFGYRFVQSGRGKAIWDAFTEIVEVADQGINAPGTEELRELGCKQAFVMDMSKLEKLGKAISEMNAKPSEVNPVGSLVACMVGYLGKGPSCDEVAATYVEALGGSAPQPFAVMVRAQSSGKADCFHLYSGDGKLQKDVPMPESGGDSDVERPE